MSDQPLFADVLMGAMMDAGYISCSELARRVWGTTTDTRGYTVARNRDAVGRYLTHGRYPNRQNLQKIADALGVPVAELASAPQRRAGPPQPTPQPASPQPATITITGRFTLTLDLRP